MTIGETYRSVRWTYIARGRAIGAWGRGLLTPLGLAAMVAALAIVAATSCYAQREPAPAKNVLTPAYLLGNAISMSDKSFPDVEDAIKRFNNLDGPGALEFLVRAVKKNPKLPPATLLFAKMQDSNGNVAAVRGFLERTVLEHPEDPESYLILADQAFQGNRTTESDALFQMAGPIVEKFTANRKRKRNFEVRILAGFSAIAERRGQWDKSQELLTEWVESDPENAMAHRRLGLTLFKQEKPKEALREFATARDLNADLAHPYVVMAQLFHGEGKKELARKAFERAYEEEPGNETTAHSYADWLIYEGKLDQAHGIAKSLREQDPNSVPALLLDGAIAHMRGDMAGSEQALQKLLSLEPRHALAADLLALLLIESDQVDDQERALSYAELNAERYPDNPQANITKAWVLYKLGRKTAAQKSLNAGTKGGGQMPADSRYLIAKIMVAEGHRQKALNVLQPANVQNTGLYVFRADAQRLLKELQEEPSEPSGLILDKQ